MAWGGVNLDLARTRQATGDAIARLSPDEAAVDILVIPNDVEGVIAQEGGQLLGCTQ